jgi:acyl-coenzyme A thioesterase PaaI-like protein
LMQRRKVEHPPCTVTSEYAVRFLRPTPAGLVLTLVATVAESKEDRAVIDARLLADGHVCATCRGTFVAVRQGHPAYNRW